MTGPSRILIIEDMASLAMTYAGHLEKTGHVVDIAGSGAQARAQLASTAYDVVLLDLQLPDCDGLEWLAAQASLTATTAVIVVTSDGSIKRAIAATRQGAYDFLVKPLSPERLLTTVRNAIEKQALTNEVKVIRQTGSRKGFHGFIGQSNVMQAIYRAIENVADSRATVFITGESGTGKEVAAEAIHASGRRAGKPFVAINCGAIPENLLESELFGHLKGAFTGAVENRPGAAREADGGTLFLDEICEMDIKLQVKLLRFLQTGMVQPVGSSKAEKVDVRVVCATNRDPVAEVAAGRFREDLFYRLAVIPLEMPALRDRGGDIELIAEEFIERFSDQEGKTFQPIGADVRARLKGAEWFGNVRELQNVIRRSVIMSEGDTLRLQDFAAPRRAAVPAGPSEPMSRPAAINPFSDDAIGTMTLDDLERWAVEAAIVRSDGSLPRAARALGISPSTLYRKRERWNDESQAQLATGL